MQLGVTRHRHIANGVPPAESWHGKQGHGLLYGHSLPPLNQQNDDALIQCAKEMESGVAALTLKARAIESDQDVEAVHAKETDSV